MLQKSCWNHRSSSALGEDGRPRPVSPDLLCDTLKLIWKKIDVEMKKIENAPAKGVACGKIITNVTTGKERLELRKRIASAHGRKVQPHGHARRGTIAHGTDASITVGELAKKFCRFVCISGFKEGWFTLEFPATANTYGRGVAQHIYSRAETRAKRGHFAETIQWDDSDFLLDTHGFNYITFSSFHVVHVPYKSG